MKKFIQKILNEEKRGEYILEIPNLMFIPNVDLGTSEGITEAWNELLRLLKGKPFMFDDDLYLGGTKITSLGNLQSVGGDLSLAGTELTSLENLKSVDGSLKLYPSRIVSLGNLQFVGGDLNLTVTKITSLGNLQSVVGNLNLRLCYELTSLGNLQSVDGFLNLYKCYKLTSLGNLQSVGGFLDLRNTPISKKYSKEEIRQMVDVKGEIYF